MAWIETVDEDHATGDTAAFYQKVMERAGTTTVPNVYKSQSLAPDALIAHDALYRTLMFGRSPLRRYQREMIAVHVSVRNACHY